MAADLVGQTTLARQVSSLAVLVEEDDRAGLKAEGTHADREHLLDAAVELLRAAHRRHHAVEQGKRVVPVRVWVCRSVCHASPPVVSPRFIVANPGVLEWRA